LKGVFGMDWVIKRSNKVLKYLEDSEKSLNFSIKEMDSKTMDCLTLNTINTFILLTHMEKIEPLTTLKVWDKLDIVLSIVTPLFHDVKVLYENNIPTEIMLTNLKKETKNLLDKKEIHPLTLDLYGPKLQGEFNNILETVPNMKYY
jgi:hypothetical protein